MKKYGLQLRVQPSHQKKLPPRAPLSAKPPGFRDDDDDDVETEILRQASKNKSLKDIEEQHKKALEEDPTVFDYDGVYDDMKEKVARPRAHDREERKPKYIQALMKKAEIRQREQEIVYERKLAKERSQEDHLYADKDKFITSAYKKKLAEQAKWMAEERLRELREAKDDVTKKTDISDFYFNLEKNVAFGAKEKDLRKKEVKKPENQDNDVPAETSNRDRSLPNSKLNLEGNQGETSSPQSGRDESSDQTVVPVEPTSSIPAEETSGRAGEQPSSNETKRDHHKRNEDAVAAAKERFLARKRAKATDLSIF
ncbi:hypothetical protein K2173_014093 [Erythroxylum novogranatense]|uniref:Nuclear speckle splicing regulatory protein 1 N-terminal domain-containing protein n=1 Tax=Erythroxylum novogranatense TaxID=1862640 RepID=A0AAV8SDC4_9ROSI|nr:hypothetical protein K2173_014093 [Erythroxylum novogranatense]